MRTFEFRKEGLEYLQKLPLEEKITLSKNLIVSCMETFGEQVYISFSGGKDSTVLSSLVCSLKPDILHLFSDRESINALQHTKQMPAATSAPREYVFAKTAHSKISTASKTANASKRRFVSGILEVKGKRNAIATATSAPAIFGVSNPKFHRNWSPK